MCASALVHLPTIGSKETDVETTSMSWHECVMTAEMSYSRITAWYLVGLLQKHLKDHVNEHVCDVPFVTEWPGYLYTLTQSASVPASFLTGVVGPLNIFFLSF